MTKRACDIKIGDHYGNGLQNNATEACSSLHHVPAWSAGFHHAVGVDNALNDSRLDTSCSLLSYISHTGMQERTCWTELQTKAETFGFGAQQARFSSTSRFTKEEEEERKYWTCTALGNNGKARLRFYFGAYEEFRACKQLNRCNRAQTMQWAFIHVSLRSSYLCYSKTITWPILFAFRNVSVSYITFWAHMNPRRLTTKVQLGEQWNYSIYCT